MGNTGCDSKVHHDPSVRVDKYNTGKDNTLQKNGMFKKEGGPDFW